MYNKLILNAVRVYPWRYDDQQNTCLASVIVLLGGAYHNGSNEIGITGFGLVRNIFKRLLMDVLTK